jgi:TPR repeat protein
MPVGGEPVAGEKDASTPPGTKAATAPVANTAAVTHAPTGNQAASAEPASTPLRNTAQNAAPTSVGQNTAGAKSPTASGPGDRSKLNALQQPGSVAAPTADQPKPSPRGAGDVGDAVAKKAIPGAEEIAKANNASDSVAEAAWLWKATAKGNPDAPVRLADMYIKGNGVPRSCEQAMVLLKTAATKANALARNRLASMYNSGTCVARNRVEAYRWLSSALVANPNSEWARQNRDSIWQQMTAEERTQAERYR